MCVVGEGNDGKKESLNLKKAFPDNKQQQRHLVTGDVALM
jgi:hypothetical protein